MARAEFQIWLDKPYIGKNRKLFVEGNFEDRLKQTIQNIND